MMDGPALRISSSPKSYCSKFAWNLETKFLATESYSSLSLHALDGINKLESILPNDFGTIMPKYGSIS